MLYKSKNRTFNYKPRFSKENHDTAETSSKKDFVSEWKGMQNKNRKAKTALPIVTLVLFLVLLLIGMYVLDSYIK